ncbi:MAG: cyclopropane-fatty-acyl-phospholipid synthase family protein, partial [Acidobacteriota bacterium]|nr:cyclopropane-fatty-acyl-phospholipid synthase family protein [Acidobacteriota bacterium]
RSWDETLEQAQMNKLEMICRKLRLEPGKTLLEVGCGWGALLCYAAQHHGVRAHGITLSRAQEEFVGRRIRERGLEDRVTVELRDYVDAEGSYDRVVSVAMLEHVGVDNLQGYFDKLHGLLDDRGVLMVHGIANRAKRGGRSGRLSSEMRLAQKYLLPGLELADIGSMIAMMQIAGLEIHDVEGLREHYALTSRQWCERLYERRKEAIALVGSERYILDSLCFAGMAWSFQSGSNSLYQIVATRRRKGASPVPPTRADLYAGSLAQPRP